MPDKYHIHTEPAPPRFRPVGKLGIVDWREDCSRCHNCVKKSCVYGFYREESDTLRDTPGYLDYIYQCKGCLTCIQNCTKNILTRVVNPEYERLGDEHYTPDVVLTTWYQAATGRIPVSGSGYGGRFSGPGFDAMWTDMSEIVRPTRDGIHGREYINTGVDIGRRLSHLAFADGALTVQPPPLIESPVPLIFDVLPEHWRLPNVRRAIGTAAAEMGIFAATPFAELEHAEDSWQHVTVPVLGPDDPIEPRLARAPMVMLADEPTVMTRAAALKQQNGRQIVAVRLTADPTVAARALALAREGAEVLHLRFQTTGNELDGERPRHMRDVLRDVHGKLVKAGVRDELTIIASGGIALAEHMTKAVICGADLVAIDIPLILALECRMCGECTREQPCQIDLPEMDAEYGAQRVANLMAAWRNQLLEMLGAMGIREARRLRGETGRCMFFEDLEEQVFGRLFGKRRSAHGGAAS